MPSGLASWRCLCPLVGTFVGFNGDVRLAAAQRNGQPKGPPSAPRSEMTIMRPRIESSVPSLQIGIITPWIQANQPPDFTYIDVWRGYMLFISMYHEQFDGVLLDGVRVPLEFVMLDDSDNKSSPASLMRYIVEDRQILLLLASGNADWLREYGRLVSRYKALVVAPVVPDVDPSKKSFGGPLFFSMMPNVTRTFVGAFKALAGVGAETFSVLTDGSAFMRNLCNLEAIGSTFGLRLVRTMLLGDVMAAPDADALFICAFKSQCNRVRRLINSRQLDAKAIFVNNCQPWDEAYAGGVTKPAVWHPSLEARSELGGWTTQDFNSAYRQTFGQESPSVITAAAFAACEALVLAVEQANSRNPKRVAATMRSITSTSIYGPISFDQGNQLDRDHYMAQFDVNAKITLAQTSFSYPKPMWVTIACVSQKRKFDVYGETDKAVCGKCAVGTLSTFDASKGRRVCVKCTAGSIVVKGKDGGKCSLCDVGRMFTSGSRNGTSNMEKAESGSCLQCPPGTFQAGRGQHHCDVCKRGFFTGMSGSRECTRCDSDLFGSKNRSAPMLGSLRCSLCPDNSICAESEDGLFKSITNAAGSAIFATTKSGLREISSVECPYADGDACLSHGRCIDSAEGPLCGRCRPGYGKDRAMGHCESCDHLLVGALSILADAFGFLFVICVLSKMVLMEMRLSPIVMKLLITYVNLMAAVWHLVPKEKPLHGDINTLLKVVYVLAGETSAFTRQNIFFCLSRKYLPDIPYYRVDIVLGILSMPFFIFLIVCGFVVYRCIQGQRGAEKPRKRVLVTLTIVCIHLGQPMVVKHMATTLVATRFDSDRVASDPGFTFGEGDHRGWMWLATCQLFLFAVGVPSLVYLRVAMLSKSDLLLSPKTQHKYGFLYEGYKSSACTYESICMLRKAVVQIVAAAPFATTHTTIEARRVSTCVMLGVTYISYHVHCQLKPYDSRACFILDRIEKTCLEAVFFTVACLNWHSLVSETRGFLSVLEFLIVAFFHLRFLRRILEAMGLSSNRTWTLNKNRSTVVVQRSGFKMSSLSNGLPRLLLFDMCSEIAEMHLKYSSCIDYNGMGGALQRIAVHASFLHAKRTQADSASTVFFDMVCKFVDVLPLPHATKHLAKQHILAVKEAFLAQVQAFSAILASDRPTDRLEDADVFSRFTTKSFERTLGREVSVEMLFLTMLSLDKDVCNQNPPPPSVQNNLERRHLDMTTGLLDDLSVYRSELRSLLTENSFLTQQMGDLEVVRVARISEDKPGFEEHVALGTRTVASAGTQPHAHAKQAGSLSANVWSDLRCEMSQITDRGDIEATPSLFWSQHMLSNAHVRGMARELDQQLARADAQHELGSHDLNLRVSSQEMVSSSREGCTYSTRTARIGGSLGSSAADWEDPRSK